MAALIHRQQTLYWLFTQTKLSSIYRNKLIVTCTSVGPWWNVKRCLQFRRNSNRLAIMFFFFSVARSSKACGERSKTLKSWRGIYPSICSFLLCHGKAVNLLHLWKLEWRNVKFLWKKQRNTTWSVIKRDIYLDSTLSYFTTGATSTKKTEARFQQT